MRDEPLRQPSRNEEWICTGEHDPKSVHQTVARNNRGRHAVCIADANDPASNLRADYGSLGYRLRATEAFMVHRLESLPLADSPAKIVRVQDAVLAEQVNKAARARQILPEHLSDDAPLRQYVALIDQRPVGWVRSITVRNVQDDSADSKAMHATWISNMYVRAEFRRKGIGSALLSQLLGDDRAYGAKASVLTASHAGAQLYHSIGFERIATLLNLVPPKLKAKQRS